MCSSTHFIALISNQNRKMSCAVYFVNSFLRVSIASLGSKALGSMAGTPALYNSQDLLYEAFCHFVYDYILN